MQLFVWRDFTFGLRNQKERGERVWFVSGDIGYRIVHKTSQHPKNHMGQKPLWLSYFYFVCGTLEDVCRVQDGEGLNNFSVVVNGGGEEKGGGEEDGGGVDDVDGVQDVDVVEKGNVVGIAIEQRMLTVCQG